MSSRAKEMYNNIARKVGREWITPEMRKSLKKRLPNNKIVMGRAHRGIFAGRHIQFGNQISEEGGNKSRRTWKPNVQDKRLFSYVYDRFIRVKVTTHALRCIDRAGGIDEYLLKTPYQKLDNELGVLWKAKIEKKYEELNASGRGILCLMENRKQQTQVPAELDVIVEVLEEGDADLKEPDQMDVPSEEINCNKMLVLKKYQ